MLGSSHGPHPRWICRPSPTSAGREPQGALRFGRTGNRRLLLVPGRTAPCSGTKGRYHRPSSPSTVVNICYSRSFPIRVQQLTRIPTDSLNHEVLYSLKSQTGERAMRRFLIPLVFVLPITLAAVIPVAASGDADTKDHSGAECGFSNA